MEPAWKARPPSSAVGSGKSCSNQSHFRSLEGGYGTPDADGVESRNQRTPVTPTVIATVKTSTRRNFGSAVAAFLRVTLDETGELFGGRADLRPVVGYYGDQGLKKIVDGEVANLT